MMRRTPTMDLKDTQTDEKRAALIAAAPDLLALAHQFASECAECGGVGEVKQGTDPTGEPAMYHCDACFDIRTVIAKAEGR